MTSDELYLQVKKTLIPKLLSDIEESKLSVNQAVEIADELKMAIERNNRMQICVTSFRVFK